MEPPTHEMLLAETREAMEAGIDLAPRSYNPGGKSASWTNQEDFAGETLIKGEYPADAILEEGPHGLRDGIPAYGCNNDGTNESGTGNALEDLIVAKAMPLQRISYVYEGLSLSNYFNASGGAGNDMLSAVYQLFSDNRAADPTDLSSKAQLAELSYNSGLLGEGIGPGGDCTAAEAFEVAGKIWRRFNSPFAAMPGLNSTPLYNIFIAPAAEVSNEVPSLEGTVGRYQPFYFGTVSSCYGGAWIISLTSSTSECETFNEYLTLAEANIANVTFTNPLYGILLRRWQDMSPGGTPWDGPLGWPVFGPRAYAGGAPVLTARGQYYAWGMWFEHGYMWWVDYDQETYPDTPDEAQVWFYTGSNVYCSEDGDTYVGSPPVYYGGSGDLGVMVNVDAPLDETNTFYAIGLDDPDGLGTVTLDMSASGYGGATVNGEDIDRPAWGDCLYKYYVWAFRDGTILAPGTAFDPNQRYVTHTYGSLSQNRENTYVVRVQITDANDEIAYGDSLGIHLGHQASGSVLLLRNDGGDYPANYNAIKADLESLKGVFDDFNYVELPFSPANIELAKNFGVVIWYRGGPAGTPTDDEQETRYTDAECDGYNALLSAGVPILHMSQNTAAFGQTFNDPQLGTVLNYYYNYNGTYYYVELFDDVIPTTGGWDWQHWGSMTGVEGWQYPVPPSYYAASSSHNGGSGPYRYMHPLSGTLGTYYYILGQYSTSTMGEDFIGTGSSGKYPYGTATSPTGTAGMDFVPHAVQVCSAMTSSTYNPMAGGGGTPIMGVYTGNSRIASWGNNRNGYFQYFVGYPWASVVIKDARNTSGQDVNMARWELLQNILASLKSDVFTDTGANVPLFAEYSGPAEILQVQPVHWGYDGTVTGGAISTSMNYPDPTSPNIYRNTADLFSYTGNAQKPGDTGYDSKYIVRSTATDVPADNFLNGNDITFQYPWYGYVDYGFDMAPGGGDDYYFVGGLLLEDPMDQWVREPGSAGGFGRPVAGWYSNSSGAPDAGIRANYGASGSNLVFTAGEGMMSYEAIAHWPSGLQYGVQPAYLGWSLFPGHTVVHPYDPYPEYGIDYPFARYQLDFDVDPNSPTPPSARDEGFWLQPLFSFAENRDLHGSRVVEIDYSLIRGWNPDMDGDGTTGESVDDKFPVRCRVMSDWTAYMSYFNSGYNYPDNFADPDTFVELGCYVADQSAGNPAVYIYDDGANLDPYETASPITFDTINFDFFYGLGSGTAPYTVELDANFDPTSGDGLLASFGANDPAQVYTLGTGLTEGLQSQSIQITQPVAGYYLFALRVTDADGDQDLLWYGNYVYIGGQVSIDEDDTHDNPDLLSLYTGSGNDHDIDLYYRIDWGWPNYTVELDSDYTGTFDNPIAVASGLTAPGYFNHEVTITQADGTYTMALRVTDSVGGMDVYVFPDTVTLSTAALPFNHTYGINNNSEYGRDAASDSGGNTYVAFSPYYLGSYGYYKYGLQKWDSGGNLLWSRILRGTYSTYSYDYAYGVVVDEVRNAVYLVGYTSYMDADSNYEMTVAKFDLNGNLQSGWPKNYENPGYSYNYCYGGADVDSSGNLVLGSHYSSYVFVTKISGTTGAVIFSKNIYRNPSGSQYVYDLDVAPSGEIYVGGYFYVSTYYYDGFVTKLDSNGNFIWDRYFRGPSTRYEYQRSVEVDDATGDVYVGGYSSANAGNYDWWVSKVNSAGTAQWSYAYGSTQSEYQQAKGLEMSGGNLMFMGQAYMYSGVGFGAGYYDFAAFKINPANGLPAGAVTTVGNYDYQYPYGGAVDPSGNAIIAGYSYNVTGWVTNTYSLPSTNMSGMISVLPGSASVTNTGCTAAAVSYYQLTSDPSYILDTGAGSYDTAITKFTP